MSELEEHYILRVPENIAEQLRAMIRERKMPPNGVSFHLKKNESGVREGVFRCGTESVRCSLLDLPHNVETFITSDNVNFYKSADIGQVVVVHPPGGRNPTIMKKRGTYDAIDGITPPLKRAYYRYREDKTGVSSRTIAVAESELSAILKGDNEIIEELEGDAVDKAERELELHNAAEAKAAEDRAAARQARQLKKRQKLLEPKPQSPTHASSSSTADTGTASTAAAAASSSSTGPPPSNIIKIALPKPPGSAPKAPASAPPNTFKTPAPVDKSSRQSSAAAQTPSTPATAVRAAAGLAMQTPATPDVAAKLRFAPPTDVKSEPMDEDDNDAAGDKKLSKEERKAAKKAAKAAKKAAKAGSSNGHSTSDAINIDDIDLMTIDVPTQPIASSTGGFRIKIKMSSSSSAAPPTSSASSAMPPPPPPTTVKVEPVEPPRTLLASVASMPPPPPPLFAQPPASAQWAQPPPPPPVVSQPFLAPPPPPVVSQPFLAPPPPPVSQPFLAPPPPPVSQPFLAPPPPPVSQAFVAPPTVPAAFVPLTASSVAPPPVVFQAPPVQAQPLAPPPPPQQAPYVNHPEYVAALGRVHECEAKAQAAQKVLEEDEAKAANAPNPMYALKLKSKVATSAAARDAAQAELNNARAALQAFVASQLQ